MQALSWMEFWDRKKFVTKLPGCEQQTILKLFKYIMLFKSGKKLICKWIIFFNYMIIYYFTCSFWRIERLIFLRRNKIFIFGDCLLVFNCNRHSLPRMKFVFNLLPREFQTFGPCEPLIPWGNFPRPPFKECSLGERTEFFSQRI